MRNSQVALKPILIVMILAMLAPRGSLASEEARSTQSEARLNVAPKGFVALFNGEDLSGWKGLVANPGKRAAMKPEQMAKAQELADAKMNENWRVEDGILIFAGKGSHLCTVKDYGDFEMLLDWKIESGGDSGIYLRGTPQVQIWDPAKEAVYSGGLYNNQAGPSQPLINADNPAGEWNHFHITMIKNRVTVLLNDKLVVDNTILENYWERDKPIVPDGQIELQSHGTPLYFRNIFLREIPRDKAAKKSAANYLTEWKIPKAEAKSGGRAKPADQTAWQSLFNGKDLTGWRSPSGEKIVGWKADGRKLVCDGTKGAPWLATEKQYGDFELRLEFRLTEGGNSGVFLRTPLEGNPAFVGMEIQLLDDNAQKHAKIRPEQKCGSIYDVVAAKPGAVKSAGEWQSMLIVCQGRKAKVTLNDQVVVDAALTEYADQLEKHPGLKCSKGHIGLQNHSSPIEFRNIRIRELK